MEETPFRVWDGDYEKVWYEVKSDEGTYLCWPNAGSLFVCANVEGKHYVSKEFNLGDDFTIRETDKHPLDYIFIDKKDE